MDPAEEPGAVVGAPGRAVDVGGSCELPLDTVDVLGEQVFPLGGLRDGHGVPPARLAVAVAAGTVATASDSQRAEGAFVAGAGRHGRPPKPDVTGRPGHRPLHYDVVHINAEFADQASDHDPQIVRIDVGRCRP
ncbi:hypothetical protein ACFU53_47450, partial [Streptomyces sp. NPDC057474]|uniref:hypothetical protein n=1 Tax=Streptomyces sp. NPDC057474 TaxID=3346144 RepID=UPI0036A65FBA